jgi:trehalose-6-phosphate synthase
MKQILTVVVVIFTIITLIAAAFTINQVNQESQRLKNDIQYRSSLLADSLKESVEPNFINKSGTYLQGIVERFADQKRIAGLAVIDNKGKVIAVTSTLPSNVYQSQIIASNAMDADKPNGAFVNLNSGKMYVYAQPLHDKKSVVGALLIVQNATYINEQLMNVWTGNMLRTILQALLLSIALVFVIRWLILLPIQKLGESLKLSRHNKNGNTPPYEFPKNSLLNPLLREVNHMQQSLIQAKLAATEEARLSLEKLDSPWTANRLKEFVQNIFNKRTIIVVSLREPYIHTKEGNTISYKPPVTGVITAIEPILEACGGLWIALATGNADKLVVDENDKIAVPPDNPKYTLKRVWLVEEEINGFYYGASKQGISRVLHMVHTKPIFLQEDWQQYKKANEKYADAILEEIKNIKKPIILIQDFQFVFLPQMIKSKRPDATIMIFWHVTWVNAESFSTCPWKKEILEGMLGADLLGFHTQLDCNNFVDSVARELEAKIDFEKFAVIKNRHTSLIRTFPASINFTGGTKENASENEAIKSRILKDLGIKSEYIGLGVDRLDNVKGVLERIRSIEIFLKKYPEYIGKFTFIQLSSPIDSKIAQANSYSTKVTQEIERINNAYKTNNWKPIVFIKKYHTHQQLDHYYRLANFCLITSLHEGMNLISKEFVASRDDEKGVLILSQFAGASKEFSRDALIINPYDANQTADTIHTALKMNDTEQTKRMKKLRNIVKHYNTYRWAAEILKMLVSIE